MRHAVIALCLFASLTAGAAVESKPFASLDELRSAMRSAAKSGKADPFWNRVLAHKTMPLVFGDQVVFLWRGDARKVEWKGDFTGWDSSPDAQGKRLGKTDIWALERTFPRDGRFDYKLFLDGRFWDLDPLNPFTQVGGYGPNSELRMPDWKYPANAVRRDGIARGTLSKDIPLESEKLGYVVNYRVYTPPGFDPAPSKGLPVLYATDGSDYANDAMGSLVITLDNLIADSRIAPVIVVFIDAWDRKEGVNRRESELIPAQDRRCAFCEFMVDELIPAIDADYPTDPSRLGRAIVGTSLGGLHATLMSMRYGRLFGMAGIESPAFSPAPWVLEEVGEAEVLPARVFIDVGAFEGGLTEQARVLRDRLRKRTIDLKYVEPNEGHSWGHWRAQLDDMLVFFFGR